MIMEQLLLTYYIHSRKKIEFLEGKNFDDMEWYVIIGKK